MDTVMKSQSDAIHERLELLDVNVSAVSIPLAVQIILEWIAAKTRTYVCVAPVSTLVDCQKNADYKKVVNQAGMVTPDGMPVVWMGRMSGNRVIERTYGPDLMLAVAEAGLAQDVRHFWYGGQSSTLKSLETKLKNRFPSLNVVGQFAPPFTRYAQKENEQTITMINEAKPDILWVGLGSPKQDFWMSLHRPLLDVPVIIGVGAAFDFLSGQKAQAPRWMQHSGLEWLFRLASEPRRLWRRYLIGNVEFLYFLGRAKMKQALGWHKDEL
jgi:N-acetylglucosaminyldiphosphoundecaprenol N-acetyl-beta-D-mannosaminyltransferase